jgi:regulator of protease activity HflC (stomatin/prohibitin superfamily)
MVWRDDADPAVIQATREAVRHVVTQLDAELEEVLTELRDLNEDHALHELGSPDDIIK